MSYNKALQMDPHASRLVSPVTQVMWLLHCMDLHVYFQVTFKRETISSLITRVRLSLCCGSSHVFSDFLTVNVSSQCEHL